jgi:hypothetical protein
MNDMEQRTQALKEQRVNIKQHAPKMIWITFQREGIHCYPQAATDPALTEVKFLGYPHRHIFHFRVWIQVFHDDRDLEFIIFKRWCESLYNQTGESALELNNLSCEMIADQLYEKVAERYPSREIWIEVSEDGENGCFVKYNLN